MLYAKIQDLEPILLDQTRLTDESIYIYKIFEFKYLIFID